MELSAATYIIKNMKDKYSYCGETLDSIKNCITIQNLYPMKNNYLIICLCSILLIGIGGCSNPSPTECYSFASVRNVNEFPLNFQLSEPKILELDEKGFISVGIKDSIMLITTKNTSGSLSLYSIPGDTLIRRLFPVGNGHDEVQGFLFISNLLWKSNSDSLMMGLRDFKRGNLRWLNFTNILQGAPISSIEDSINFNPYSGQIIPLRDGLYYNQWFDIGTQQIRRGIFKTDREVPNSSVDRLNSSAEANHFEMNNLAVVSAYSPEHDLIIEAPCHFRRLNLYSPTSGDGWSIQVGDLVTTIKNLGSQSTKGHLPYAFRGLRVFPDYWCVLYFDPVDLSKLKSPEDYKPRLLFFDWEGNPLCSLSLECYSTEYGLDPKSGNLYVINEIEDEILQYPVSDILKKI